MLFLSVGRFCRLCPGLLLPLGVSLSILPTELQGQVAPADVSPRFHAGGHVLLADPLGGFGDVVDVGVGLHGFGRAALDPRGLLSLRAEVGFLNYGNESQRVCLSATVGCRIEVDLVTSNNIFLLNGGPELAVPLGSARLYGLATAGLAYFTTESSVSGSEDHDTPFAQTRNFSDATFAWTAGGGVQIPVYRGWNPVHVDLAVRYHGNGQAQYLTPGDIEDLPGGEIRITPRHGDTNLLTFQLGVSVGIRAGERPHD